MKWKLWTTILSSSVLLSGCAIPTGDFCDLADVIYIDRQEIVDYLADNDPDLLRGVVAHNELTERCR